MTVELWGGPRDGEKLWMIGWQVIFSDGAVYARVSESRAEWVGYVPVPAEP